MCARAADRMKTCLADALWGCLETRSLTGLSVGDVIEVAGVSRGSFYYHFSDLDHLVSWALARELLRELADLGDSEAAELLKNCE